MARIFKVEGYVVCPFEDFDGYQDDPEVVIQDAFENTDFSFKLMNEPKVKEFEWDDDLRINYFDCTPQEAEEFYEGLEESK